MLCLVSSDLVCWLYWVYVFACVCTSESVRVVVVVATADYDDDDVVVTVTVCRRHRFPLKAKWSIFTSICLCACSSTPCAAFVHANRFLLLTVICFDSALFLPVCVCVCVRARVCVRACSCVNCSLIRVQSECGLIHSSRALRFSYFDGEKRHTYVREKERTHQYTTNVRVRMLSHYG